MTFRYLYLSKGWVYNTFHTPVRWGLVVFFRSFHLNGFEKVPGGKPVLLAVNHPTAFIDPLPLCTYMQAPIFNMTRGDIFQKPFFRKLLEQTNMFPVFRVRDGYVGRDRNAEVFEWCKEKLHQGCTVTIYVEGEHHLEKRVRPAKKGIANIAFGAYAQYELDELQIFPVGCAYRYGDRARDEGRFTVGEPLWVRDYWPLYQENANQAIQKLCQDIETALKKVCYHLDNEADEHYATQALTLFSSENPEQWFPSRFFNTDRFAREKAVLDRINQMEEAEKAARATMTDVYFAQLAAAGLDDDALHNAERHTTTWRLLLVILGFLPFALGWLSHWPVRRFTYWLADKKVKKKEFYSSIVFGAGVVSAVFYYLFLLVLGWVFLPGCWGPSMLFLLPLAWFSIIYVEITERYRMGKKAMGHRAFGGLREMRAAVSD